MKLHCLHRALALAPLVLAGSLVSTSHGSVILDFNDLPDSTGGAVMPATYGGLRWGSGATSWHSMSLVSLPGENFLALSGTSTFFGSVLVGDDFYFEGADFWSRRGLDGNGDFAFVLYHDGLTVYNGMTDPDGRQRFSNTHALFVPSYTGPVDGVAIAFDNDDWDHLAMDNVRITFIPVPGSCAIMVLGTLFAASRRR